MAKDAGQRPDVPTQAHDDIDYVDSNEPGSEPVLESKALVIIITVLALAGLAFAAFATLH